MHRLILTTVVSLGLSAGASATGRALAQEGSPAASAEKCTLPPAQQGQPSAKTGRSGQGRAPDLADCNGVLKAPPVGDQGLVEPAPSVGETPVIRPGDLPGTPQAPNAGSGG
ncbi:hypothetical protein J2858_000878 [Neorhizobium galegae]|uniref:hypothetical protein n=1 Tax=Neorhizobium galegae TaxID=399 RepID=UPI001AEA1A22|nr:hypothetical protein [Neorhizobium galegae]MBP2547985.1 hypothetical protein [Neorhizobium galegae]